MRFLSCLPSLLLYFVLLTTEDESGTANVVAGFQKFDVHCELSPPLPWFHPLSFS